MIMILEVISLNLNVMKYRYAQNRIERKGTLS